MTGNELKKVYWLKKELKAWQDRRAELDLDIAPPVKVIDGMPFANTNGINRPTEDKAIRLKECATIIDGKITELTLAIADVEKFICTLEDPFIRFLLQRRCIDCLRWEEIAVDLEGYTAEALRKAYSRFVKGLEQ